jgi:hypothetical protein
MCDAQEFQSALLQRSNVTGLRIIAVMVLEEVISREDALLLGDDELEALLGASVRTVEISMANVRVLTAVHGERRLFEKHGCVNEAEYVARKGLARKEARRLAHQGRVLARHPYVAAAHADGRIHSDRLELLLRMAKGQTGQAFAEDEETLVDKVAQAASLKEAEHILADWRDTVTADGSPPPDGDDDRVDWSHLFDRLHGQFDLCGENAEMFQSELDRLTDQVERADKLAGVQRCRAARRADALALMAERSASTDRGAARPLVVMVMTHEQWMNHEGGTYDRTGFAASAEAVARNLCDCRLGRIIIDDVTGRVIDFGRDARCNEEDQRLARIIRDGTCVFGDCDTPAGQCHGHHWRDDWIEGGLTNLEDLASTCPSHHRLVHESGWKLHGHEDGSWTATSPDGLTITRPPRAGPQRLWR